MSDFSNNKDDKLAELQSKINALQKSLTKNSISVKTLQRELQVTRLEAEQSGADLAATNEQLEEANAALKRHEDEIEGLQKEQGEVKVGGRSCLEWVSFLLLS